MEEVKESERNLPQKPSSQANTKTEEEGGEEGRMGRGAKRENGKELERAEVVRAPPLLLLHCCWCSGTKVPTLALEIGLGGSADRGGRVPIFFSLFNVFESMLSAVA